MNHPLKSLMLAFIAVLLLADVSLAKDIFEEEVDKEAVAVKLARETVKGGYPLVTAAELKKMTDEGKAMLIIDTMPFEDSFKKEHVPGAVNFVFPIEEMDAWDASKTGGKTEADYAALLGPDKNRPIVVYCGFVKCGRSHNAAVWAKRLGYTNVSRFPGGIYAWKGAGFPIESVK